MFLDIGLIYDPTTRRCDMSFAGNDFALDRTPATPMLVALGASRRARPDDELPIGVFDLTGPAPPLSAKRGWCGDALDALGRLIGSRLWLLDGRKQTETTRLLAQSAAAEALETIEQSKNVQITLTVQWIARGLLGIRAQCGETVLSIPARVSA